MSRVRPLFVAIVAAGTLAGCLLLDPFDDLSATPQPLESGVDAPSDAAALPDAIDASCTGIDTTNDTKNCGSCGRTCASGFGCAEGRCGNEVVLVGAGNAHTCAALRRGDVYCWGSAVTGETGTGAVTDAAVPPTLVPRDTAGAALTARELSLGEAHGCAFGQDRALRCWGSQIWGVLSDNVTSPDGTPSNRTVPYRAHQGSSNIAGTPVFEYATVGHGPFANHGCAALADGGTLACWGSDTWSKLGDIEPVADQVTEVDCDNGTDNCRGLPSRVANTEGTVEVALGRSTTCARDGDGGVLCWGSNRLGQLGNGAIVSLCFPGQTCVKPPFRPLIGPATAIATGADTSCAIVADRSVWCWGVNNTDQLGRDHLDPDSGTGCCYKDLQCAFYCNPTPTKVPGIEGVTAVTLGLGHVCALREDRTVWCWGANDKGQLGTGDVIGSAAPRRVSNITDVAMISAGKDHTCAVTRGGDLVCWGGNDHGQIGGGTANAKVPVSPVGLPR